jgi:hypothetical protein
MIIRHVEGNLLKLQIPLTEKVNTVTDGEVTSTTRDFVPSSDYPITVAFVSVTDKKRLTVKPELSGNILTATDCGKLKVGKWCVEVLCKDMDGNPRRFKSEPVLVVVDRTQEADIEAGTEFDAEENVLDASIVVEGAAQAKRWVQHVVPTSQQTAIYPFVDTLYYIVDYPEPLDSLRIQQTPHDASITHECILYVPNGVRAVTVDGVGVVKYQDVTGADDAPVEITVTYNGDYWLVKKNYFRG